MVDNKIVDLLKIIEDKKLANLLRGIYSLFETKFPSQNYGDRHHIHQSKHTFGFEGREYTPEAVYTLDFMGREYDITFLQPPGENMVFALRASLKGGENLESMLKETTSNTQLEESKYLSERRIDLNGNCAEMRCRIKKYPRNESEVNKLCKQLWGELIKPMFLEIGFKP